MHIKITTNHATLLEVYAERFILVCDIRRNNSPKGPHDSVAGARHVLQAHKVHRSTTHATPATEHK